MILSSTGCVQSIVNFRDTFFFCPLPRRTCFLIGPLDFFAGWKFMKKILLIIMPLFRDTCEIVQNGGIGTACINRSQPTRSRVKTKSQRVAIDKLITFFLCPTLFRRDSAIITNNCRIFAGARTYQNHLYVCSTNKRTEGTWGIDHHVALQSFTMAERKIYRANDVRFVKSSTRSDFVCSLRYAISSSFKIR